MVNKRKDSRDKSKTYAYVCRYNSYNPEQNWCVVVENGQREMLNFKITNTYGEAAEILAGLESG